MSAPKPFKVPKLPKLPRIRMTLENEVILSVVVFYIAMSVLLLAVHHWPFPKDELVPAPAASSAP